MKLVFDLDNTISNDFGTALRPGIAKLLKDIRDAGHDLAIWSHSTTDRGENILRSLGVHHLFSQFIFREDWDPQNEGIAKDIRVIGGQLLVDDDPKHCEFTTNVGLQAVLVSPFRELRADPADLVAIRKAVFPSTTDRLKNFLK